MNANVLRVSFHSGRDTQFENSPKLEKKQFTDFVRDYLKRKHRTEAYKNMYRNMTDHFDRFCKQQGIVAYTNSIDEMLCDDFVYYLQDDCNLMLNTVASIFEKLKAMIKKAANCGYPVNMTYQDVIVHKEESDGVFLDDREITRIYYFQGLTQKEEEIRDLFILGCKTGLRYSDYSRLTKENFNNGRLYIKTKKTGEPVVIPVCRFVQEILHKYNYNLIPQISLQHFNKILKQICLKVGLTYPVLSERTKGSKVVKRVREKWQCISSHTARRSAATNMYIEGIDLFSISLITGHKNVAMLMKYIKVSREENALRLASKNFFK